MAPRAAPQNSLPLEIPSIIPFSAINSSALGAGQRSSLIRFPAAEGSDASLGVAPTGTSSTVSEIPSTELVAEKADSRNESGDRHRAQNSTGASQPTFSCPSPTEAVTSVYPAGNDRNYHDFPKRKVFIRWKTKELPVPLQPDNYEGPTRNEAEGDRLRRPGETKDQLLASASDSSKLQRNRVSDDTHDGKCGIASSQKHNGSTNSIALETTEVTSISGSLGRHVPALEQDAALNRIPLQDRALTDRDDQPSADEGHQDILCPSTTAISMSNGAQLEERPIPTLALTIEAHHQEMNHLPIPDHAPEISHGSQPDDTSMIEPNGAADIRSRKRKASQEIIHRIPAVKIHTHMEIPTTTQPSGTPASELLKVTAAVKCGSSAQIWEDLPKASPPSSPNASAHGISITTRDIRKVKPEVYLKDSQALWTKWPYGNLRDHTIGTLFGRLAQAYELPPEQVWAIHFTFPDAKDQASLFVSRENPDSFKLLHKRIWEVGKTCKVKEVFRIHADPYIDPDAESELELDAY
ncbi:hypothetical protein MMC11_007783 [Xylographa trunciseda]|nr:hypothetical protein [Xylographa trunciseda]